MKTRALILALSAALAALPATMAHLLDGSH